MVKKDSAVFDVAHFDDANFDVYFFVTLDKAEFVDLPDKALFDVAHFDTAYFDKVPASSPPRFDYARFSITNPLFEKFKAQIAKSI